MNPEWAIADTLSESQKGQWDVASYLFWVPNKIDSIFPKEVYMDIKWLFKIKTVKISNAFSLLQSSEDNIFRKEANKDSY